MKKKELIEILRALLIALVEQRDAATEASTAAGATHRPHRLYQGRWRAVLWPA